MRMFSSGRKVELRGGIDDDAAAGEAFADVIVGVAFEFERDALGEEGAEALSGGAGELEADGVVGQTGGAVAARDFAARAWRRRCGGCCGWAA